ncbi:MAG: arsenosugar biosynthesis radical SAM protein ArsS [Saprospiraceae bacterium]|nr:arsenosugar biosynthesis radical SAM protein ArsS [Saprospiraceae bacterium]MBK8669725.1 arsenosugar biosynthesis radical SAM protein ArsS [Saprospiraceae bacterium]
MGVKQRSRSLSTTGNKLASTFFQLEVLNGHELNVETFEPFALKIGSTLQPTAPEVLQINIGKLCNQTCAHCHVDAGPDKKLENMDKHVLSRCLEILETYKIPTVDITGGAPEMHPHFRWFVEECRKLGKKVMNRCNLTIIMSNPKYHDLPEFFAKNDVHIISSLPYFTKTRTDSQRGDGVFEDSIQALKKLNAVGYGVEGSGLILDLVYNPSGAFLPGHQSSLEHEFKLQLARRYQITFNHLFVITNLPISRFLDYLLDTGNYSEYMSSLIEAFNPQTISGLMCRYTLSVSWEGYIYDCDFNQMLDLKVASTVRHVDDFDLDALMKRNIVLNQHCYGCTAGAGSSCGGEIA